MTTSPVSATALRIVFSFALLLLCSPCLCLNLSVCQNASSCGHLTGISYPLGLSNSGCGHPDFQIHCISETPHLTINDVNYTVLDHSLTKITVVNDAVVSADQTCSLPNAPVNLSASPFTVASAYSRYLTLCLVRDSNIFPQLIPCNFTWLYHLDEVQLPYCDSEIQVPIIQNQVDNVRSAFDIEQILRQGFEIEWNETDEIFKNCTECKAKKGICGFNSSARFICSNDLPKVAVVSPISVYGPSSDSPFTENSNTPNHGLSGIARGRDKSYTGVIIGVCVGSALLISAACIALFLCYKKHPSPKQKLENSFSDNCSELGTPPIKKGSLPIFSYTELEHATDNFNVKRELGDGGFASVYLGKLSDGRLVAVKKLFHHNSKRVQQFYNEIEILPSLNHPNLVLLIGYCRYRSELLLVYEYASNGTLADHLHRETKAPKSLVWEARLNIAIETAQALSYLHFSVKPPIIHRDVKSSNILLDQNFRAKVADFGLSRMLPLEASQISTGPQGTPGYVDPDYHYCFRLTDKSDVYSFGVVLAELISAKKAVDMTRDKRDIGLANLAVSKIQSGALHELVDPNLEMDVNPLVRQMVSRVAELAFRCLAAEKDDRPNMMEVAAQLQEIKQFGYGGSTEKELGSINSFDGVQESRKLLSHVYAGSPTSVQEKWSTSTTPDSSENGFV